MYQIPLLRPLSLDAAAAVCCTITVRERELRTILCAVEWCQIVDPCSVSAGPVSVSG